MTGDMGETAGGAASGTTWRSFALVTMAILGVLVLVALSWTLREADRQRDRALALQKHSYEVMILSANLSGTLARAEASLGRYVISVDDRLGQAYSADWQLASQQISRLKQITHDNPDQQGAIEALRRAFRVRSNELGDIALNTFYKRNDQALALYYKARQAPSRMAIDTLLDTIGTQERTVLDQRTGAALASVARSSAIASTLGVFGVLILLGALAMGWMTVTALGQRAAARAEAETERDRSLELEAAVAKASAELLKQEAKLRQVQKLEAVGQLTGGIAHDFNNMLAVVIGGLELARRHVGDDPQAAQRHIANAAEGADRAAALTRRLLAFSREESLRSETLDPATLIGGMSDLLDRTLGDGITVVVRHESDGGWMVRSDRIQLENAVLNLAVNARDAMDGRGQLTITVSHATFAQGDIGTCAAGDFIALAVCDTGCGMPPELVERVFEPFFTTKPSGKGTGLGLSQVFAFVRQAAGEVVLESTVGVGTTVTLYLPRHIAPTTTSVIGAFPAAATPERTALDIFVVEDDPRVLNATMGALEELGHRAVACDDPIIAPGVLDGLGNVDLIISDVLMPGRTGPELIDTVTPQRPDMAVLFVTGYAGEAGGEAQFGGRHVLRKPFTLAGLARAIDAAVQDRPPHPVDSIAAE
ncbi:ATP-binding protein [Sphingomonas sp. TREG-RG-20F-R18-01]|uniref:ATP-binding protein n=1 Tax=Sphingomonas sp. TREG-RG-20F-R18-01 TaxID=2914982 RepID=UPI001F57D826|nr:ATP-binding protein [Sphingomonas sp. TREG-RG-20F-R18-01]